MVALALLGLTTGTIEPPSRLNADLTRLLTDSPDVLRSVWQLCHDLLPVWVAVLAVAALFRRRFVLVAMALVAVAVAFVAAWACHRVGLEQPSDLGDFAKSITRSGEPADFPAVRLALGTAIVMVVSPAVTRPLRFFGRTVLLLAVVGGVGVEVTSVSGAVAGLAVGAVGASCAHLAFGSPGGRPTLQMARDAVLELGVRLESIEPASFGQAGESVMDAVDESGRSLTVKLFGRDAWDGQLLTKVWRLLWYREAEQPVLWTRLHQVEHEALLTTLAGRVGVRVPEIVSAGATLGGDAVVVTERAGTPLEMATPGTVTRTALEELWATADTMHRHGIVHGAVERHRITWVDGSLVLEDWSSASSTASHPSVLAERAQLLALSALLIGIDSAVGLALKVLGTDAVGELVPYLQGPALTPGLRRDLRDADLDLDALRDHVVTRAEVDQVELVRLRRVTVGSVLTVALLLVAASLLISGLSDIGFDTIADQLSEANWSWVVAALAVAQFARFFNAIGTTGATDHPLRLGPTIVLEFAITFVNLAVPSSAGRIATKMRFFQKQGMSLTSATAMGAIDSLGGFVAQLTIVVGALVFGIGGVEFDVDINPERATKLLAAVAIVIAAGVLITFTVASIRDRVLPHIREFAHGLRVLRSPGRLLRLLGGNLMAEVTFSMVLLLSLSAYGESAPLTSLIVVNTLVALFAGLMPVPGGIGVTEAATTAGLIAIGMPEGAAFATAITARLCTFYLPPIWGWFAMRWLQRNQYL